MNPKRGTWWARGSRLARAALAVAALLTGAASTAQAAPTQSTIIGEIERITIDRPDDVWSGGSMVVGGHVVILPRNLLMDLPANRLTLQQLFAQAPADCIAKGETGLAKGDACNASHTGGIATIAANRTNGGDVIAGDLFVQKAVEAVSGVVTFVSPADGYFRIDGIPGDATTGTLVRLNDPDSRHSVQKGPGCAGGPNCSPDPRFTLDPDNYTASFTTGYPLCIPSTTPRTFTDTIDVNRNGNTTEVLTAQAGPDGRGDLLCPDTNRTGLVASDSRRFAPIVVGDHVSLGGNFETVNGVRFLSVWKATVSVALGTGGAPDQPDYVTMNEMFIDAPAFQLNRIRALFIGAATQGTPDVLLFSLHYDPQANDAHEFPLGSVAGCDLAAGAGTCATALGPNTFRINHDTRFAGGGGRGARTSVCAHLRADPRFSALNLCPAGGTLAEEFSVMSPLPHEIIARSGKKFADLRSGAPKLKTVDVLGNDANNGEFLFPMGVGLGGIETPTFAEIDINALFSPFNFEGFPWALDRRLSPGGCNGTCESTPQPLDPFPFSGQDPRFQATLPITSITDPNFTARPLGAARDRILSFVDGGVGNFNGDRSLLAVPPVDPAPRGILPTPPLAPLCGATTPASVPPLAVNDSATAVSGVAVRIPVLANDTAGSSPIAPATVTVASAPSGGTATANTDGTVSYLPALTFSGVDFFTYSVKDATGVASNVATVVVTVSAPAAPTAITGLLPAAAPVGSSVLIQGTGLSGVTGVSFGGVAAQTVQVVSSTLVSAIVPSGAVSGAVTVVSGTVSTTGPSFTVQTVTQTPPTAPTAALTASANPITAGSPTTLSFTTTNATAVTLSPLGSMSTPSGTVVVAPAATTTFTLVATGPGGTASAAFTVVVLAAPPPPPPAPTATLVASATSVTAGGSVTLTFSSTNATSATLTPFNASVSTSGSVTVTPTATTTYTFTATGAGGTASASATVTVTAAPPPNAPTATLVASASSITAGGSVTLTFSSTNATSATLTPFSGAVGTSGSVTVAPTTTTTYTFTATGAGGSTSATATVTVTAAPPPTSLLFEDLFNRSGSLGAPWAVATGGFTLDGATATSSVVNWGEASVAGLSAQNARVETVVRLATVAGNVGVALRVVPTGSLKRNYAAYISDTGTVAIYRRVAGVDTRLASRALPLAVNTPHTLSFSVTGTSPVQLTVLVDGAPALSFTDTSTSAVTAAGTVGILGRNTAQWDSVRVFTP